MAILTRRAASEKAGQLGLLPAQQRLFTSKLLFSQSKELGIAPIKQPAVTNRPFNADRESSKKILFSLQAYAGQLLTEIELSSASKLLVTNPNKWLLQDWQANYNGLDRDSIFLAVLQFIYGEQLAVSEYNVKLLLTWAACLAEISPWQSLTALDDELTNELQSYRSSKI